MYDEVENETNCVGTHVGELNVVEPTCSNFINQLIKLNYT